MKRRVLSLLCCMLPLFPCFNVQAEWVSMTCTAYTDEEGGNISASGKRLEYGMVASDDLPIGTIVYVNGQRFIVEDRFGGGYSNRLDIYMNDYDSAIEFGRQTLNVYVER